VTATSRRRVGEGERTKREKKKKNNIDMFHIPCIN
jgi:hypothetical protein